MLLRPVQLRESVIWELADTDYDRLFLDGKEQKFYDYKGEKVYLSVEYAWSHDSIVSGI